MKKLFLALLVTVMSFTLFAKINASAADPVPYGYSWVDQYTTDGKSVILPHGVAFPSATKYGYSGTDVLLGNYVVVIPRGNVFASDAQMANPAAQGYGSLAALYTNTSADQTWYFPKSLTPNGHFFLFFDKNGKVYDILNDHIFFEGNTNFDASQVYNVWWDDVNNQLAYNGGADLAPKLHETHTLTYAELGTTYRWLTKEAVDAKTADGVTFQPTDLVYTDASNKYTNVAEGNTPELNKFAGFEIPAGGSMLVLQYWDTVDYMPLIKQFWTLVNGNNNVASIVEHDITAPVLTGFKTGTVKVPQYSSLDITGVTATDTGLVTILGDETAPAVTTTINKFDPVAATYSIPVTELNSSVIGAKFQVTYSASDASAAQINTATKSFIVEITATLLPVISGAADKTVNTGDAVDLTTGVTVDDGYGNDITSTLVVNSGSLNVASAQPGTYKVDYIAYNSYNGYTHKIITITVLDTVKPVAYAPLTPVVAVKGTDVNLTSYVFGVDNYSAVTKTVIDNEGYDKDTVGTYNITVRVADVAGNKLDVTYVLEVVEKDVTTRVGDLESEYAALEAKLNEFKTSLQDSIDFINTKLQQAQADLNTDIDDLSANTGSKDQNSLILTVVVGVVALAGVGAAGFSLKRK